MLKIRTESVLAFLLTTVVIYLSLILPAYCYTSAKNFKMQQKELEDSKKGAEYTASFTAPAMDATELYNSVRQTDGEVQYINARFDDVIVYRGVIFPVVVTSEKSLADEAQ